MSHHHEHHGHQDHHEHHGHEQRDHEQRDHESHGQRGGEKPGPKNVDLELSQMLGDHAGGLTRDLFMEVLRDSIKEEIKKMPEVAALVAQAAKELSEDIRLSLQIEELIALRDKGRESRKSDLLAALLKATGAGNS